MHPIDIALLVAYFLGILSVGLWFLRRNTDSEDYYVGGRSMGATHVGLSVVATDVGGGFSIGLGGLGFMMGLSGSWMLFTGLIGAVLASALLVPRVHAMGLRNGWTTYPQVLVGAFGRRVVLAAAVISGLGYVGFTASQLLAGAKLASSTVNGLNETTALYSMGALAVLYTALGGMKAVIFTDTFQWMLLLVGLIFVGLPFAYAGLGGMEGIRAHLPAGHLILGQVTATQLINWFVTITPIWFIGMTLYQRIYACRDEATARRAWLIAGAFEWPIMAFLGVILGVLGRVAWQQGKFAELGYASDAALDPELGLPLLLATLLPIGAKGLMLAAYFSAILSTADSCLMAASGNLTTDLGKRQQAAPTLLKSQAVTLAVGVLALVLASSMTDVLDLMLYSYQFMVAGLLIPTVMGVYSKSTSSTAALTSMALGGTTTLALVFVVERELVDRLPGGLDPILFGLLVSGVAFAAVARWDAQRAA